MTLYCPKCGSANLWPQGDPWKVDEEIEQVLKAQMEECFSCRHVWKDMWWEVWTPDGTYNVDADENGNAIRDND